MDKNKLSSSLEDYLEAIHQLAGPDGAVGANQVAQKLAVSKSSVTWALNQLSQKGYIQYHPYEPIRLTPTGRQEAGRVVGRHTQIREFLRQVLGVDEPLAEANACKLEHVIDRDVLERMGQFTAFLDNCPRAGRDWLDQFRYLCNEGKNREKCPECLSAIMVPGSESVSDSIETPVPASPLPKRTKERDQELISRLEEILQAQGEPLPEQQVYIFKLFMNSERHTTCEELHRMAQARMPMLTLDEVQGALDTLCEYRLARRAVFGGRVIYEHFHPESHHDHFYCLQCGAIEEFYDPRIESLQMENARRSSFRPLQHTLNIMGICSECLKLESQSRTLASGHQGELVRVVRLLGDRDSQSQLAALGLNRGVTVEILNDRCANGGMILLARGTRLLLDRKLLEQVRIRSLRTDEGLAPGPGLRRRHRHQADRPGRCDEGYRD